MAPTPPTREQLTLLHEGDIDKARMLARTLALNAARKHVENWRDMVKLMSRLDRDSRLLREVEACLHQIDEALK